VDPPRWRSGAGRALLEAALDGPAEIVNGPMLVRLVADLDG
jgi:hypothetical protein